VRRRPAASGDLTLHGSQGRFVLPPSFSKTEAEVLAGRIAAGRIAADRHLLDIVGIAETGMIDACASAVELQP